MDMGKYVANIASDVIPIDKNIVVIKSLKGQSRIKGAGMYIAIQDMIKCFREPVCFDNAIVELSKKYGAGSLQRLFELLIDKDVLISEHKSEALNRYSDVLLEKVLFYTSGGKDVQEIIDDLKTKRIGIVGQSQLVFPLLDDLVKSRLLFNFNIGTTDDSNLANISGVNINEYPMYSGTDLSHLQAFVENSDFLIAASNFYDHCLYTKINELCINRGKNWLRVAIDGGNAEIGPLFISKKTCCYVCLCMRGRLNMSKEDQALDNFYASKIEDEKESVKKIKTILFYPLYSLVSIMACAEVMKFLTGVKCNLINQVLKVDSFDFETKFDYIYKDYICPSCGQRR